MAKFCGKCGTPLDEETGLCPKCDEEKLTTLQKDIVYKKNFCNQCGSSLDENGLCPKCDYKKHNKIEDRVDDQQDNEDKPKKEHKVLKIIGMVIVSLAIIAIAAIAIFFLLNNVINKDSNDSIDEDNVEEVEENEEETSSEGITINTYDYTLAVGEYVDIDMDDHGNGYSIVSNDFDVVSYSNGQLYGVGAGKTTVTITYGTQEYTLNVTVVDEDDDSDEYIFANSSTELLTDSDVENLSSDELRIARNEIYARHGCYFEDEELQAYFESCSWYENKNIKALDYYDSLSDLEKDNIKLIQSYE